MALMMITSISAVEPSPDRSENAESTNLELNEGEPISFYQSIIDSLSFLSAVQGPDQVNPNSDITFDSSVEAKETFNLQGTKNIVEIYKCQDSSCDDGNYIEAKRDYNSWDADLSQGAEFKWSTTYNVPNDEGYYSAVAYMIDENGNMKTDAPEHIFVVGSVEDDTTGDDTTDGTDDTTGGDTTEDGTGDGSDDGTDDGTTEPTSSTSLISDFAATVLAVSIVIVGGVFAWVRE